MIRVSCTVSSHWGCVNPGVITGTITGAATKNTTPKTSSPITTRFATVETTRQARSWAPPAKSPDTIGIRADDSAPAATSWNSRSGIRNAAKNASRSGPVG